MTKKKERKPRGRPPKTEHPIPQVPAPFEELLGAVVQPVKPERRSE